MVSGKVADTSVDEANPEPFRRRVFVTPSSRQVPPGVEDDEAADQAEPEELGTRTVVVGVVMVVISLVCFVLVIGSSGSSGEVRLSDADAKEIFSLREDIKAAEVAAEELPEPKDAERGLVIALQSASRIAKLQNDYRSLTPEVAEADGDLDPAATARTRQELTPYFTPSVDAGVTHPWYLLASDASVAAGIGIPSSFDSGFTWVVDVPTTIGTDGLVPVTWRAIETNPGEGQEPAVLAWVSADYDITRSTFSDIRQGTTVQGAARELEVNAR